MMHLIAHDVSVPKIEESECTETVIDRDDHNARFHQRPWVVVMPCALRNEKFSQSSVQNLIIHDYLSESTSVNPDHHRHGLGRLHLRSEHIEVETVLHSDHLEKY